ncbi:hypothetical protein DV737_g3773, partial [Chaetothyriales sp. CBS 132003]
MLVAALSVLLLPSLLPCVVAGDDQVPLASKAASWLEKAKAYIPSSAAAAVANPSKAVAKPVVERTVEQINRGNYQRKLAPKAGGDEEWLVYLTGGNKTCFGDCRTVDLLWNEVLCTAWQAVPPAAFHFLVPSTDPPGQKTPLRVFFLNHTTTTVDDIASIPSGAQSRYLEEEEYKGALHPFDSLLAKTSLLEPLGYVIWTLGNTPSWLVMVLISFISRQFMAKRMTGRSTRFAQQQQQPGPAQGAPAGAGAGAGAGVPAAAPAAKGPTSPKGSAKKRR